jgi:uncharacterized protein (UPF0276 family)
MITGTPFPPLRGLGIGWRPELALAIDRMSDLSFVEITAENHPDPSRLPEHLHQLRERGLAVIPHGIGLSLGGAEAIGPTSVRHLAGLARALGSPLVSEHVAFVRAGGREAGHLLPIPRTRAALGVLVDNVKAAQGMLDVPLALENISALFEWPAGQREYDEAEFLCELVRRTDCWLLLDVANVYANARNLGGDPLVFLSRLPAGRIAYMHMGGGYEGEHEGQAVYHDTHAHAVPEGAVELLRAFAEMTGNPPGVMLERDDNFPPEDELLAEMSRIRRAMGAGAGVEV